VTVLVAYASRHGATREIAEAIADALSARDVAVDVRDVAGVDGLEPYHAVVLGSAVYFGKWLEPARNFVEAHADELAARPTWLFSSGPVGDPPFPGEDDAVRAEALVAATNARGHRLLGGKLDPSALGLAERMLARVAHGRGDYRDWNEIDTWAADIAAALQAEHAAI
jgi:menaquinone-dependent protoporphyrinogen oxidase